MLTGNDPIAAALLTALIALVACLILVPPTKAFAWRAGVLDHPDTQRKFHRVSVPRIGGLALMLSFLLALGVAGFLTGSSSSLTAFALKLVPGAMVAFFLGLADDIRPLPAKVKLAGQIVAAAVACAGGMWIHHLGSLVIHPAWGIPLTIFWLVACANAANLIDGVDGLAGSIGLTSVLTIFAGASLQQNHMLALTAAAFGGALLGILRHNWRPASIFLGDSGSLTTGFLVGGMILVWIDGMSSSAAVFAPLLAFAVPLLEVALSASRRFLSLQPIFRADARHLHHLMLRRGLSPASVSLLLGGVNGMAGLLAVTMSLYLSIGIVATLLIAVLAFTLLPWLGYKEFSLFGRALSRLAFHNHLRQQVAAELALADHREGFAEARSVEECWTELQQVCSRFGFAPRSLFMAGHRYEGDTYEPTRMAIEIMFSDSCVVGLVSDGLSTTGDRQENDLYHLDLLVNFLKEILPGKATALATERIVPLPVASSQRAAGAGVVSIQTRLHQRANG